MRGTELHVHLAILFLPDSKPYHSDPAHTPQYQTLPHIASHLNEYCRTVRTALARHQNALKLRRAQRNKREGYSGSSRV